MKHASRAFAAADYRLCRAGLSHGFTLIELLVVLLVMGVLAGAVRTVVQPDQRTMLRVEVERLAQLLDLAAKESQLTGRPIAWTADGTGYRFSRFSEDLGWSRIVDEPLYRARILPRGINISAMKRASDAIQAPGQIEFEAFGGNVPFSIEMSIGATRFTVVSSAIGEVSVVEDGSRASDASPSY